ncbi:MAG: YtxH domain-containing protein [Ilyomonas sp.]
MSNQKLILGIILGAAAGTLATWYLTSDKGQELLADVKETAKDVQGSIKDKLSSFEQEITDLLNKGKQFVQDIEGKVAEKQEEAAQATS